jgi:hypothetical protein
LWTGIISIFLFIVYSLLPKWNSQFTKGLL